MLSGLGPAILKIATGISNYLSTFTTVASPEAVQLAERAGG
jgi:hypothetical protein